MRQIPDNVRRKKAGGIFCCALQYLRRGARPRVKSLPAPIMPRVQATPPQTKQTSNACLPLQAGEEEGRTPTKRATHDRLCPSCPLPDSPSRDTLALRPRDECAARQGRTKRRGGGALSSGCTRPRCHSSRGNKRGSSTTVYHARGKGSDNSRNILRPFFSYCR